MTILYDQLILNGFLWSVMCMAIIYYEDRVFGAVTESRDCGAVITNFYPNFGRKYLGTHWWDSHGLTLVWEPLIWVTWTKNYYRNPIVGSRDICVQRLGTNFSIGYAFLVTLFWLQCISRTSVEILENFGSSGAKVL